MLNLQDKEKIQETAKTVVELLAVGLNAVLSA